MHESLYSRIKKSIGCTMQVRTASEGVAQDPARGSHILINAWVRAVLPVVIAWAARGLGVP